MFPVGPFYVKDCELHGFAMFNYSAAEQRQCGEDLNRWLAEGKLRANIDRTLPLAEARWLIGCRRKTPFTAPAPWPVK